MPGGGGMMPGGGFPGGMNGAFGMPAGRGETNITLSETDVEDLEAFVPDITAVSISASARKGVTGGELEEETQYTIAGVKEVYQEVSNLSVALGEFITEEDDEEMRKTAVLGASVAEEIFGSAMAAYDSVIYVDSRSYTVGGVLEKMGTVSSGISPDEAIFIPFSTAKKYVMGSSISPTITVVAEDVQKVETVIENVRTVLGQSYPSVTFTISDAGSKMEAASASANTLAMLLVAVASIVFIVGGIGIMNVLFVSVKERTKEIGILKALGSSKRDILLEFLTESNMISTFGGLVGIGLSFALVPAVRSFGMRVEPSWTGALLALAFAVFTGTVFGFYPALKASNLIPVEALSEE